MAARVMGEERNRWVGADVPRGERYDERFERLAASGANVHGEADLVDWLLQHAPPGAKQARRVLDAGCGTGRVAIELARRGCEVVGVDIDPRMLAAARAKTATIRWIDADLAEPALQPGGPFDAVVAAGNVMIFLAPATEPIVVANLARHLADGGILIAGFQLDASGGLTLERYDSYCEAAGLTLRDRWATWDRAPFRSGGSYAVSVHQAAGSASDSGPQPIG